MSLQPDLTYKVFIVSYDFTEEEKETIINNGYVSLVEKATFTLLENYDSTEITSNLSKIYYNAELDYCYELVQETSQGTGWSILVEQEVPCPQTETEDDGYDDGGSNGGGGYDSGIPDDSNVPDYGDGNGGNSSGSSGNDQDNDNDDDTTETCIRDSDGNCIGNATSILIKENRDEDCLRDFSCRPGEIMDEDCECRIDLEDPCANKDLINYEVSSGVVSMIESRQQPNTMVQSSLLVDSFILETIDDGWGDVNQDRFSIKINELPNGYTPFQLFNEIRMNFTNLVVGGDIPYFTDVTLEPYSNEDGVTWNSDNPVGAAMDFDTIFDTSTVYCVEYNEDEMYWIFATVTSYDHQGHFVAGVRQFGLEPNGSGGYSFYVRAADRLGGVLDYIANGLSGDDEVLFSQAADKTWKNLMENTASLIQNQGGNVDEFDETETYGARHPYDEDDCQD